MAGEGTEAARAGLITAVVEETFEPLHTGKSLVLTIAPNGKVWGKRLDEESTKRDVEIEIFAPVAGGYQLHRKGKSGREPILPGFERELTVEQQKKIKMIFSQEDEIYYLLGTLQVGQLDSLSSSHFRRPSSVDNIYVLPCRGSYSVYTVGVGENSAESKSGLHRISYDDYQCVFNFESTKNSVADMEACKHCGGAWNSRNDWWDGSACHLPHNQQNGFPRFQCFSGQAKNGIFNLRYSSTGEAIRFFQKSLRVMFKEHNFFDLFAVDDAVLLLEEERMSEGTSTFHWTLAIVQNKLARNLVRLSSNNPDLFRPLLTYISHGRGNS